MMMMIERPTRATKLIACVLSMVLTGVMFAGDKPGGDDTPAATTAAAAPSEVEQLKKMLLDQQRQIDELRRQIAGQKFDSAATAAGVTPAPTYPRPSLGEVASTTPILPPVPAASASKPLPPHANATAMAPAPADETSPLQLKIGDAYITPVGFHGYDVGKPIDEPRDLASAPISAASPMPTRKREASPKRASAFRTRVSVRASMRSPRVGTFWATGSLTFSARSAILPTAVSR